MSGHSKWATIHRQKEVKDAKRGAIFTKLAANIVVAVRQGGGIADPDKNFRLRLAIDKARQFNMPKENVARAIEKGVGGGAGGVVTEVSYEGFLPGGCAVIIEAVTDNRTRCAQQVRLVLEKHGGTMGSSGSVSYLFSPMGFVRVKAKAIGDKPLDEQELEIMDVDGIEDIETDSESINIYCDREKTYEIREKLVKLGWDVETAELIMKPATFVEIGELEKQQKIDETVEALEELDDVTHVFTNYLPE